MLIDKRGSLKAVLGEHLNSLINPKFSICSKKIFNYRDS